MYVIAEIGCNHKGSVDIAAEMIESAAHFSKVNAVKFQKRNPKECLTAEEYYAPHPKPDNSYGGTYGEHRERLELDIEAHLFLRKKCRKAGIAYGCSVWDMLSLHEVLTLEPDFIKIPSAHNTNNPLLQSMLLEAKCQVQISMGMTGADEEKVIVDTLKTYPNKDVVIFACTSGYPVAFEDLCLKEIGRLKQDYGNLAEIGYSGHHLGIAADIAAMTLGATYIERHYTLNRTWKGTDHAASLEPDGMRRLVRDLHAVNKALEFKPKLQFLPVEAEQRRKLKCWR